VGNACIMVCPDQLSECWWQPLMDAGFEIARGTGHLTLGDGSGPVDYGGTVRRGDVAATLNMYRSKSTESLTGPENLFIQIPFMGQPKGVLPLAKSISRILVASGAKTCFAPFGFKMILRCPPAVLQDLAQRLQRQDAIVVESATRAPTEAPREGHLVVRRGRAEVELFSGFGLDCWTRSPQAYVAIDYATLLRSKSAMVALTNDLKTILEAAGAEELEAVQGLPGRG
jgi:hypothetical protein